MSAKNLGQVSALYIGPTPPTNIKQIWYDDTPSQRCHKVYDTNKAHWVIIDQKIISRITYSEITGLASSVGLDIGKYYAITDKGNVLALAITSTKVQYTDVSGNIVVDDLGVNRKYHVTSSNLLVDDVEGVFDETTRKLIFRFTDTETPNIDDYILAKGQRSGNYKLLKYRLSRLISQEAGNSLGWRNGLYFSIKDAIANVLDRKGGLVSYDTYLTEILKQTSTLEKIAKNSQDLPSKIEEKISDATSSGKIFNKTLQDDPISYPTPVDVRRGDTLNMIVGKYNAWLKSFKTSKGISIGADYTEATTAQYVNSNDSVQSAIGKIMYWLRNMGEYLKTSRAFSPKTKADNLPMSTIEVAPDDELNTAVEKLQGQIRMLGLADNGILSFGDFYLSLKQGSLVLDRKIGRRDSWVRVALGATAHGDEITTSGRGLSIVSDYMASMHYYNMQEYKSSNPMIQKCSMIADDFGVFSSGSSIVYWTLKRGNWTDYNREDNRIRVASSIIGLFNLNYAQRGVVPSNPMPENGGIGTAFEKNNAIYAGVFGSVDMKSVDDQDGVGGLIDGGYFGLDEDYPEIQTNKLWFGGVFDRLLARGLVYGYANSDAASDYLYSMKSLSDGILISQYDTFVEINAGSSLTGGLSNKVIMLPIGPVPGQMIKVLITTTGKTKVDLSHKMRIQPHPNQTSMTSHKIFYLKDGSTSTYLSLSVGVLYEFLYTSSGWKCFSQNPHEVKP